MTIILKDNDVLKDEFFSNTEFDVLIRVDGDNVLIENIIVNSPKKDFHRVIEVNGKNCVIKGCRFSDISVNGPVIVVEHKEGPENCVIQDCLFYGGLKTDKNNGLEAIRLGESETSLVGEGGNIVYRNRFENWDREIEIVSVKNGNNLLVNNEVVNCAGTLTLRHGQNNVVAYNFVDGKAKKDSGGIRVVDDNHSVIGNVLFNVNGDGLRSAVSLMCGIKDGPLNRYGLIKKCFILNNTLFNCKNGMTLGMEKKEANVKPEEVYLQYNNFVRCENKLSPHKDNKGCVKLVQGSNQLDPDNYPSKPREFELKGLLEMKKEIVDYTNNVVKELKDKDKKLPVIKEEEEDLVITDEELEEPTDNKRYVDVNEFVDKLTKKMLMLSKVKQFENLQKKMDENVREYRALMDEIKNLMN